MQRRDEGVAKQQAARGSGAGTAAGTPLPAAAKPKRAPEWTRCDACGEGMQAMGHCKYLCRSCGFLRTCIDTV